MAFVLAGAAMVFSMPGEGFAAAGAAQPSRTHTVPAALRPALDRALAKDAGAAYQINAHGCAALQNQSLKACFDHSGAHFTGAGTPLALHLAAWGRAGNLERVYTAQRIMAGNRVSYTHGNLSAWWRILPIGFEQGFTITKRPAGHGELVLALAANGGIAAEAAPTGGRGTKPESKGVGAVAPTAIAAGAAAPTRRRVTKPDSKNVEASLLAIEHDRFPGAAPDLGIASTRHSRAGLGLPGGSGIPFFSSFRTRTSAIRNPVQKSIPTAGRDTKPDWIPASAGMTETENGNAITWGKLHYGKLVVTDANGKVIPATLKAKGDRILIAVNDNNATYPLTVDPLVWLEQKVAASDGTASNSFGFSVALDGKTALIGAYLANQFQGAVYVFTATNGTWRQTQKLTASDGDAKAFGYDVALSGETALIGAPFTTVNGTVTQGAAYVFTETDGTWSQTQKLTASDGAFGNFFGSVVTVSGTIAMIGAPLAEVNGKNRQGAVYVFDGSNDTWTQTQKLAIGGGGTNPFGNDQFGEAIALSNTTALIGAPFNHQERGAVFVFSDANGSWTQTQKLTASDAHINDRFGNWGEIALSGETALIGAANATVNGNRRQGKAYIFSYAGGTWTQTAELTASDGAGGDGFGRGVALSGTTALVGAYLATINGNKRQGAAYVFSDSNGTWTQTAKFTASDGAQGDAFGGLVALSNATALVGANGATVNGNSFQGAAYFYGKSNLGLNLSAPRLVSEGRQYVSQTIATNNASAASPAVTATITVPVAASFVSATATQGNCDEKAGVVTCDFGPINGNAGTATANVTLKVHGGTQGDFKNTASVAYATPALSASAVSEADYFPVAKDGNLETHRNKSANGLLKASDADGDPLTFSIVSPPVHGRVTINDPHKGIYTYAPEKGYVSGDSFTFKANDGHVDSNVATVVINIVNQAPVASDGTLATDENTAAKGKLKASDSDGDSLIYSIVAPPGHGSVKLDATTGAYAYTPDSDYFGSDEFSFRVNDGQSDSNVATVGITVKGSAPPPPPPSNNNSDGGGGFGALLLALLAALAAATAWLRNIGRKPIAFLRRAVGAASAAIKKARIATEVAPTADSSVETFPGGSELARDLPDSSVQESRASSLPHWFRSMPRPRPGVKARASSQGSGRKNQLGTKRKETTMRMYGKWTTVAAGFLALAIIGGTAFMPISSAAADHHASATRHKPSGLTKQSIHIAQKSGLPSALVSMSPQSSLKLLSRATKVGPHALDSTIKLTIALKLRNEAKLKSFLEQVQNPHSAVYHQWLTPAEFTRLYGPSKADVAQVTKFLKTRGIKILNISSNRMLIHTEATTNVYEHVLFVRINDYKFDGRRFYSTTDSPRLPRAIAPLVVNILGLNHGVQLHTHLYQYPLPSAHGLNPRQAAPPPATTAYYSPLQIAHAYNYPDITNPNNGLNVQVAILTAESSGLADMSAPHDFWAAFGLPDHTINVIPVDGGNGGTAGMGETLLDVEYSGAMGPGITQNVYVASDALLSTFTDMYNQFTNDTNPDGTARNQVMTTSWGAPETSWGDGATTDNQIFEQAAAEGISMFAAAGDSGASEGTNQNNVADFPSSSLYITAANGTQLNISDLAGDYGSEVVWNDPNCFQAGNHLATGGAISRLFAKPDWQHGPGVPAGIDMRMNSDLAATASCTKPMLVLHPAGWSLVAGTSAVAPQLAGMFAIAVAEKAGPLGQSNELIYSDALANYASDFHDVTQGCNGKLPDGTPSCAGANWDHPTGWGSPDVKKLLSHIGLQGPKGTLSGKVTAAATGSAISGAKIAVVAADGTQYYAETLSDGSYSRVLPVGTFSIAVTDYGYTEATATVAITDGSTTTQNFALNKAPQVILSGKVSDGSGHSYGLYANIKVSTQSFGQVADVWTDPATGNYSVKLPKGGAYTLNVAAAFDGYNTASKTVTLSGDTTRNFPLTITDTCTAPGYRFENGGFSEDFNGGSSPPAGWTVVPAASSVTWKLNSQQPDFKYGTQTIPNENWTGGTGEAAEAESYMPNYGGGQPYDTSLITPPIAVSSLHGTTMLRYKANFYTNIHCNGNDCTRYGFDLDLSVDGGATWTNVSHWLNSKGNWVALPGYDAQVDLVPYLPASGSFQLRWRYYNLPPRKTYWNWYAEVDDVAIGSCKPILGGLAYGQVTDSNSGDGLVGATVADDVGDSTDTVNNHDDPALPSGSYLFFTRTGATRLTASSWKRTSASASYTTKKNRVQTHDFSLKSARLTADPDSFTVHAMVNNLTTATLAIENTGSGNAHFKVWPLNAPPSASAQEATGLFASAPHYAAGKDLSAFAAAGAVARHSQPMPLIHPAAPYTAGDVIAVFPAGIAMYGLGVDRNASDLWLSSPPQLGGDGKDHRFLFDGTNTDDTVDALKAVPTPGAFYMADMAFDERTGTIWQVSVDKYSGETSHIVEFDPKTMKPTGNSILIPSPQSERGLAYDPISDTWWAGDFNSQGLYHFNGAGQLLNSAVGVNITGLTYNPVTGHLFVLVSGGGEANIYVFDLRHDYAPVNSIFIQGLAPGNDGAGLGHDCNGNLWVSDYLADKVWEVYSGEPNWCPKNGIPWLTLAPGAGTVKAGNSANVTLTFDGTGHKEFTTSQAQLAVSGFMPYPSITIPLTVIWDPQPVNLALTGTVGPSAPRKGNTLLYTLTVSNRHANHHGAATQVKLSYPLPSGVSYTAASGDATCTPPPSAGSSSVPAAATGGAPSNAVICDFGTIALGASKTETLAVKANSAGKLDGAFTVSAREPDSDGSNNKLSLDSVVIGTADIALSAGKASIPAGGAGTLTLTLKNAGPDPASEVQIHAKADGGAVSLQSAIASQGKCALSGGAIACDLGQVDAGNPVTVELHLFGKSAGNATVNVQASTVSNEPDASNNGVTAKVTVSESKSPSGGNGSGGGALGWLALAALLGLTVPALARRRRA